MPTLGVTGPTSHVGPSRPSTPIDGCSPPAPPHHGGGGGVSSEVGYDVSVSTRVALLRRLAAAMCPSRRELATSLHMATLGFAVAESGERPPLLVEELGDSVPAQDGASRRGDSVPVQDGAPRRGPDGRFTMSDGGGGGSSTRTLFSFGRRAGRRSGHNQDDNA
jgi:hypothetical protein